MAEKIGLEKLKTVEDNVTNLKYEILGINETMSSIAQTSRLDIEKNTQTLSKALEDGIRSQDQRLRDFESVIQQSLERLTLGIDQRLNGQRAYMDHQMRSYDEKFDTEFRQPSMGSNRRNYQRPNYNRIHGSPMSVDELQTENSRRKDNNFMMALKAFPAEKRFTNQSSSEDWLTFKQTILAHVNEYNLNVLESLKLAKAQIIADKCATILLQINITTLLPEGTTETVKDSTILYYLTTIEEFILGKNLALRGKMKFEVLKAGENESSTAFLLRVKNIFSIAYPEVMPHSYETNELLVTKYLMGLQPKKLRFILEKLGSKTTYTLSEIWNLANLFETVKSTVTLKNTIPQDGYTLFSRKESTRNQEICEIGTESNTPTSDEKQ